MTGTTRLSVNLAPTVAHALRTVAHRRGITYTEAIRYAIALWKLLVDERAKGNRIVLVDEDERRAREVILP